MTQQQISLICVLPFLNARYRSCRHKAVYNKVLKTHKKVCEFNKNKLKKQKLNFLDEKFVLPLPLQEIQLTKPNVTEIKRKLKEDLKNSKLENKSLKTKYSSVLQNNENLQEQLDDLMEKYENIILMLKNVSCSVTEKLKSYKQGASDAKEKLSEMSTAFELKTIELDEIQEKYCELKDKQSKECTRNVNKKMKRRDDKIDKLQTEVTNLRNKEKELQQREEEVNDKNYKLCRNERQTSTTSIQKFLSKTQKCKQQ